MRIVTQALSLERLGGIEVNTVEVARALVARGHEVHLLHGPSFGLTDVDMTADYEAAGVTVHGPFPMATSLIGAPSALPSFLPAARLVARLQPDVLWLQRFEHIVWGQVVSRRANVPLVCHLHHMPNFGRAMPYLATGVTRFVAVSDFIRQQWADRGLDPARVDVVHNAVPPETYRPGQDAELAAARARFGLPAHSRTALYYGRLTADKGLDVALDAWELLGPGVSGATLVLAGDLDPVGDPELAARVRQLAANGTVTWLPTQRDVLPLLHAADVVLFPTKLPEAFGRVALEALMTGRPVLASDIGAVPEVLTGRLDRLLVPPGDARALAEQLRLLLDWRDTQPGFGAWCAAEAEAHFSFTAHLSAVESVLDHATCQGAERPRPSRAPRRVAGQNG
ncbi:glycosyltransferase family 4 protein [Modestobacter sp. VKM Ac-2986]|uniref:glycosyltransferase family 4 protein n=1 Tax=Modestobacter sp. VKM Ac-2986 TaxID=3004140 RepID=UPI0022AB581B|nr:glycosyltransferase family 4 protein [Modestobacter sp. VKM Ac-2986]MCZ2829867.1 glycosyltransferase family 4 protein [Modestobacter sp. VKM Ac-2986]